MGEKTHTAPDHKTPQKNKTRFWERSSVLVKQSTELWDNTFLSGIAQNPPEVPLFVARTSINPSYSIMAGLPLLKLSSLLLKTITKPLSSRLKFESQRRPKFQSACASVGQASHYASTRINVFASGYKFIGVKPLPPNDAVDVGISYLSDFIVMSIGAAIIIVEYRRGEEKNRIKAEKAAAHEAAARLASEAIFTSIDDRIKDIEQVLPSTAQAKIATARANRAALAEAAATRLREEQSQLVVPLPTSTNSISDVNSSIDSISRSVKEWLLSSDKGSGNNSSNSKEKQ